MCHTLLWMLYWVFWWCHISHTSLRRLIALQQTLQQSLDRVHPAPSLAPFPFPSDPHFHSERQTLISIRSWEHRFWLSAKLYIFVWWGFEHTQFWCLAAKKAWCYLPWTFSKIEIVFVWKLKATTVKMNYKLLFWDEKRINKNHFQGYSEDFLQRARVTLVLWRALIANPSVSKFTAIRSAPSRHFHPAMFAHGVSSSTTLFGKIACRDIKDS